MKFHENKLLTTAAAVALALAVGACGSNGSDDDEMAGTPPPATTDPAPDPTDPTPDPAPDPVELADTAYDEYLGALTAYEVAQGVYALTPTAANLTALREAVDKVVTEASEALVLAGDGTAAQLVRAQNAVTATVTDSNDVAVIEAAVMAAANLVTALTEAATAATTYDNAKAAYEADEGMTQANLDALSDAATAAKEKADAALVLAAGGSAAQLSEAQAAVAAANMAGTHVSGITTALEGGIATALTAYDTAKTAHTVAKTAHDEDASLDNANALKTAADALLAAAMDAQEKGVLGATEEQKTALASVSVTNAETYATAAGTAVTTAQTAAGEAAVMAATDEAATKAEAIGDEAGQTTVAGLGGRNADGSAVDTYTMTVERPRSGTEVKVTDSANAGENDPKFVPGMELDGGRTMLVRMMEANDDDEVVEEVVIVKTDIAAPRAVAFEKFEDAGGTTPQVLDANPKTENGMDYQSLEIVTANFEMIVTDGITATGAGTISVPAAMADDTSTTDVDETVAAFEADAEFNGAAGTLRCNGATDCEVTLDADGDITAFGTGWIFTPDPDVTSDQPDYEYLSYGFWLQKTTDEDGVLTYDEVETFAEGEGHPETVDGDLSDVVGSATYEGGSVGVYVKNVLDDQANIVSATSGHYSADVELKANFGGGGVAANDQFTIGGKITDFVLQHGEENDWAVGLGLADFSGREDGDEPGKSDPGSSHDNEFSGVATGDSTAAAGSWNGVFYGSSADVDHDMDNTTPEINPHPVAVIGEFNANFTDGSTAGAYGANK